jgi:tetratricopeptide (TPR) repeat protein
LVLTDYPVGDLRIDRLELNIRGLTFPFDLTGGAHQLRDRWLEVSSLEFTVPGQCFREVLHQLEPRAELFSELRLEWHRQRAELTGRLGQGPESPWFVLQFLHDGAADGDVLLRPYLFVLLGPPALSFPQVAGAVSHLSWPHAVAQGIDLCIRGGARQLLMELLPRAGYRIPDCRHLMLRHLSTDGDGVTLSFAQRHASYANSAPQALALREVYDLLQPGDEAVLAGELEKARQTYWAAFRSEPGHPLLMERMAWLDAINPHRREAALVACERALAQHESAGLRALVASLALASGDVDEAERQLTVVAEQLGPYGRSRVLTLLGKGRASHDPAAAASLLETALSHDPNYIDALEALRDCYVALGVREELRSLGARLVLAQADGKGRARVLCGMGKLWLEAFDDVPQASASYHEALFHLPDDEEVLLGLAECCRRQGDWEAGLRCIDAVARQAAARGDSAQEAEAHVRAGQFWSAMGDMLSAATRFHRAVKQNSLSLNALTHAARADLALGRRDMAAATLRQLMLQARNQGDQRSWRRALMKYVPLQVEDLGAPKAAEAAIQSYLADHPGDEEVVRSFRALTSPTGPSLPAARDVERGADTKLPTRPAPPEMADDAAPLAALVLDVVDNRQGPESPGQPPETVADFRGAEPAEALPAPPAPPPPLLAMSSGVDGLLQAHYADPTDQEVARQLIDALEREDDWPRLAAVLSGLAENASDVSRQIELYAHLAEVLIEGLDDGESGAECLLQVAQLVGQGEGAVHARRAAALLLQAGLPEPAQAAERLASQLERDDSLSK